MMLALFVVLALTGSSFAQRCCSAQDAKEVHRMWSGIWNAEFTGRRIIVAQSVFKDLFASHPEAIPLFTRVKGDDVESAEFRAHCVRVVNGLDTCINLLTDPATLVSHLGHLSAQHAVRDGVRAAHFDAIATSFGNVMPQISNCFNPDAWNHCFGSMAGRISAGLP